jgi:hypothetical protein
LLRYYPKAVAGDPERLHALQPRPEIPLEIVARFEPKRIVLRALHNGKPVPGAKFTTVDDDLNNEEFEANAEGEAVWQPKTAGYYCVYTRAVTAKSGEIDGKPYEEVREFATIAFPWPLVKADERAEER